MVHYCRSCGALNVLAAAPVWAVPCDGCGERTPHQPHDPHPVPRLPEVVDAPLVVDNAGDTLADVSPSAPRVHTAAAAGTLTVAAAPAAKPTRQPRQPRQRRS
jgi:hypothetical protein